MYLDHFGLFANPFGLSPKLGFLFRSGAFEESMAHLVYGVDNGEPLVMITGPIGTGKTMAIQSFLDHLGGHFETALVTNTRVTGAELLKLILDDLGVDLVPGADKSDLLIAFKNRLLVNSAEGKRVLIVVDEAQNLGSDALEEIRLLTNLGQGEGQPVQLVLVGQPELEFAVDRPELAQLRQRIRVHYRLAPLSKEEIDGYVHHRLSVAGCDRPVFARKALDRIFEFSGGVPRLVNTFANEGLLAAFVAGRHEVRAEDIEVPRRAVTPSETEMVAEIDRVLDPVAMDADIEPPAPAQAPVTPPAPTAPPAAAPMPVQDSPKPRRRLAWVLAVLVVAVVSVAVGRQYLPEILAAVQGDEPASEADIAGPRSVSTEQEEAPNPMEAVATAVADDEVPPDEPPADDSIADLSEPPAPEPEVAAEPQDSPPPVVHAPVVDGLGWCAHISSFRTKDRAISYANDLRNHAAGAFYRLDDVRGVSWYRVFIGPYAERPTALAEAHRLQEELGVRYYKIVLLNAAGGS